MTRLKHVKLFESFILEKYNQLTKFYHLTESRHLQNLLKGIDLKLSSDRGQGFGFYVYNNLEYIKTIVIKPKRSDFSFGFGGRSNDLIVEIEATLDEKNFDIDYELVKNLGDKINKVVSQLKGFKNLILKLERSNYLIITKPEDELTESDFESDYLDGEIGSFIVINCKKQNVNFAYLPVDINGKIELSEQSTLGGEVIHYIFESLDKLGIKNLIEKEIYSDLEKEPIPLKYVGPQIKPTRYMMKDSNGNWGDWIENI